MNSDSMFYSRVGGTTRNNLVALTGLATAETIFTMVGDTANVNAFTMVPQGTEILGANTPLDPNANAALSLNVGGMMSDYRGVRGAPYFTSTVFSGRPFTLQVSGTALTSAASNNVTLKLYQNSTAALGGSSILSAPASGSSNVGNATSMNFLLQASLVWDSTSQKLTGEAWGVVNGNYTARAGVNISTVTQAQLLFVASVTFVAGAANACTPVEFSISQI